MTLTNKQREMSISREQTGAVSRDLPPGWENPARVGGDEGAWGLGQAFLLWGTGSSAEEVPGDD